MSNTVTPVNQASHINAFSGRFFEFDTYSSKYYIARSLNENLLAHGTDCIITGFELSTFDYDLNDVLSITISPGKAIVDMTLIEILEPVTLTIDVTPLDQAGFLTVILSYRFLETPNSNPAKLKIFYVSANGDNTIPAQFQTDYDRLPLFLFNFDKLTKSAISLRSSYANPIQFLIHNKEYTLRKMSDLKIGTLDEMQRQFKLMDK